MYLIEILVPGRLEMKNNNNKKNQSFTKHSLKNTILEKVLGQLRNIETDLFGESKIIKVERERQRQQDHDQKNVDMPKLN